MAGHQLFTEKNQQLLVQLLKFRVFLNCTNVDFFRNNRGEDGHVLRGGSYGDAWGTSDWCTVYARMHDWGALGGTIYDGCFFGFRLVRKAEEKH